MTEVQERLEGVVSIEDAIDIILEEEIPCERGPYSHSRLNTCNYQFYKKYIEEAPGNNTTRFGREYGSAIHQAAEYDVRMRVHKKEKNWLDIESFSDFVIEKHPEYADYQADIQEVIEDFRLNFDVNKRRYLSSEEKLGCKFDGSPGDFDGPETWYRGVADYISVNENAIARVVDYKNYPRVHKYKELSGLKSGVACQLMGYAALVFFNYPSIRAVKPEIYYFRYGTSRSLMQKNAEGEWSERTIDREDVAKWWRFNQRRMLAIERRGEGYFDPEPSPKSCQYCAYIDDCPVWEDVDPEEEYLARNDEEADELLDKLVVVNEVRTRLRNNLKEFVKKTGQPLEKEDGDVFFGWRPRTKKSVDVDEMIDVCEEAGIDHKEYVKSTKTNIEKLERELDRRGEDGLLKRLKKAIDENQKSGFRSKT